MDFSPARLWLGRHRRALRLRAEKLEQRLVFARVPNCSQSRIDVSVISVSRHDYRGAVCFGAA